MKAITRELFRSLRHEVLSDNDMPRNMCGKIHFGYWRNGGMVQTFYVESNDPFQDSEIKEMIDSGCDPSNILAFKLTRILEHEVTPNDLDIRTFEISIDSSIELNRHSSVRPSIDILIDEKWYRPETFPTHDEMQKATDLDDDDFVIFCDALHELILGEFNAYRTFHVWVDSPSIDQMAYIQLSYFGLHNREFFDEHGERTEEGWSAHSVCVELQSFNREGWVEITHSSSGRDCDGRHGHTTAYILKLDELDQPHWNKQIARCRNCHQPLDVPNHECGRHDYHQL
tara:strand:+ start:123 stop:977 length:855 start_codon:yes stop_codon:yes gene_type:complete